MKQYKVNTMQWSKTKSKATHKYAIKQGTRWPQPVRGCHWMKSKVVRMYGLWDCVVRLLYECLFSLPLLLPTSDTWISPLGPVLLQVHSFCSLGFLPWILRSESFQLTGGPGARCTPLSLPWSTWPLCWPGGGRQSGATAQSPRSFLKILASNLGWKEQSLQVIWLGNRVPRFLFSGNKLFSFSNI